jgi:hypothetical protein
MLVAPTKFGLRTSYALMGLTLTTGTALILTTGGHLLEACIMGILYTSFVVFGIVRTQHTLSRNTAI